MRSIPHLFVLSVLVGAGCESGERSQPTFPDSISSQDSAVPTDQRTIPPDLAVMPDQRADQMAPDLERDLSATDGEAGADAASVPDSAVCPTPPFGSTVGISAANFTIPDCGTALFDLHAQCDQYPAVVMLYSYTSFT